MVTVHHRTHDTDTATHTGRHHTTQRMAHHSHVCTPPRHTGTGHGIGPFLCTPSATPDLLLRKNTVATCVKAAVCLVGAVPWRTYILPSTCKHMASCEQSGPCSKTMGCRSGTLTTENGCHKMSSCFLYGQKRTQLATKSTVSKCPFLSRPCMHACNAATFIRGTQNKSAVCSQKRS